MFNLLVFQEIKKLGRNTAAGVERLCLAKSYVGRVRQRRIEVQVFGVLCLSLNDKIILLLFEIP